MRLHEFNEQQDNKLFQQIYITVGRPSSHGPKSVKRMMISADQIFAWADQRGIDHEVVMDALRNRPKWIKAYKEPYTNRVYRLEYFSTRGRYRRKTTPLQEFDLAAAGDNKFYHITVSQNVGRNGSPVVKKKYLIPASDIYIWAEKRGIDREQVQKSVDARSWVQGSSERGTGYVYRIERYVRHGNRPVKESIGIENPAQAKMVSAALRSAAQYIRQFRDRHATAEEFKNIELASETITRFLHNHSRQDLRALFDAGYTMREFEELIELASLARLEPPTNSLHD